MAKFTREHLVALAKSAGHKGTSSMNVAQLNELCFPTENIVESSGGTSTERSIVQQEQKTPVKRKKAVLQEMIEAKPESSRTNERFLNHIMRKKFNGAAYHALSRKKAGIF